MAAPPPPPPPPPTAYATVSAGYESACGLTATGAAYCWGANRIGQLGNGTIRNSATPIAVIGGLSFAAVGGGTGFRNGFWCGVTTAAQAYCWGDNDMFELGNGDGTGAPSARPVAVAGGLSFAAVSAGDGFTCGVTSAGTAYCWGANVGSGTPPFSATPVAVANGFTFTGVSSGGSSACGVTASGAAYCWGGALGNGGTLNETPVAVAGGLAFASVSAGYSSACAVTTTATAYCWGDNSSGELGSGTTANSATPVAVAGGLAFATVSAGYLFACGVTTTAAAYCWGHNYYGEGGNGTAMVYSATPVAVAGGLAFATVSAGYSSACGVTTAGTAYCWGANDHGELGNGTTTSSSVPIKVAGQP